MCATDFDNSPNSIYQQQELHVLVTASLFMDIYFLCCVCLYFVPLDVSLGFHFLFCVYYVNPAYGCQIEINCMYVCNLLYTLYGDGRLYKLVLYNAIAVLNKRKKTYADDLRCYSVEVLNK